MQISLQSVNLKYTIWKLDFFQNNIYAYGGKISSVIIITNSTKITEFNIFPISHEFDVDPTEEFVYILNGNVPYIQVIQIDVKLWRKNQDFTITNLKVNKLSKIITTQNPSFLYLTADLLDDDGSVLWRVQTNMADQDINWKVFYDSIIPNLLIFILNQSFVISTINSDLSNIISISKVDFLNSTNWELTIIQKSEGIKTPYLMNKGVYNKHNDFLYILQKFESQNDWWINLHIIRNQNWLLIKSKLLKDYKNCEILDLMIASDKYVLFIFL